MKESSNNKARFVSELERKIIPVLNSNPNWIDKEKSKFMASVQASASTVNNKQNGAAECNSREDVEIDSACIDNFSDTEIIDAVTLL